MAVVVRGDGPTTTPSDGIEPLPRARSGHHIGTPRTFPTGAAAVWPPIPIIKVSAEAPGSPTPATTHIMIKPRLPASLRCPSRRAPKDRRRHGVPIDGIRKARGSRVPSASVSWTSHRTHRCGFDRVGAGLNAAFTRIRRQSRLFPADPDHDEEEAQNAYHHCYGLDLHPQSPRSSIAAFVSGGVLRALRELRRRIGKVSLGPVCASAFWSRRTC